MFSKLVNDLGENIQKLCINKYTTNIQQNKNKIHTNVDGIGSFGIADSNVKGIADHSPCLIAGYWSWCSPEVAFSFECLLFYINA